MAVWIGSELHPQWTWLRSGLLKIRIRKENSEDTVIDLNNLYRQIEMAAALPDFDLQALLRDYLKDIPAASRSELEQLSLAAAQGRIMALLKPIGFVLEATRPFAGRPDYQPIAQAWAEDLYLMPVLDSPRAMAFVRPVDLKRWGLEEEQLVQLALRNLERRSRRLPLIDAKDKATGARSLIMQTLDGYDASRILLARQREFFAEHLGEPYLVGVPNRDFLIALQPALRSQFAAQVYQDYHAYHHAISPRLLRIEGEQIVYDTLDTRPLA